MTISSYGATRIGDLPVKLYFTFEYWFGYFAVFLILLGLFVGSLPWSLSLIDIKVSKKRQRRISLIALLILFFGIMTYPIGLQASLSLNVDKSASGSHLVGEEFALLNAYTGNFGDTHFALFSNGVGTQQTMAFRGVFFPNLPLYYASGLTEGFFLALAGLIVIAIAFSIKDYNSKPYNLKQELAGQ
jgi:hypothetical protein